jgi:hypothetical protein
MFIKYLQIIHEKFTNCSQMDKKARGGRSRAYEVMPVCGKGISVQREGNTP